jgi:hypothetical protein
MIRTALPGLLGAGATGINSTYGFFEPSGYMTLPGPRVISLDRAATVEVATYVTTPPVYPIGSGVYLIGTSGTRVLTSFSDIDPSVNTLVKTSLALDPGVWTIDIWIAAYGSTTGYATALTWAFGMGVYSAYLLEGADA